MSLPLKKIELHTPEQILLMAEEWLENGSLSYQKIDSDLYAFKVATEKETFEVELKIRKDQLLNYSCNCGEKKICSHVVAASILLRKESHSKPRPRPHPANLSFSTKNLLPFVTENQLREFISKYTKKNRELSLYFRLEFVDEFPGENVLSTYQMIARSFVSQYTGTKKLTKIKGRHLINCMTKFHQIIRRSFLDKNYVACQAIIQATSETLEPTWIQLPEDQQNRAKSILVDILSFRKHLLQLNIAPDLKFKVLDELKKSILRLNSLTPDHQLLFIIENLQDAEQARELLQEIRERLSLPFPTNEKNRLFNLYLRTAEKFDLEAEQDDLLKAYFDTPEALLTAIQIALNANNFDRVRYLHRHLENQHLNSFQQRKLQEFKYTQFRKLNQKQEALAVAKKIIITNSDISFLDKVIQELRLDKKEFSKDLLPLVQNQRDTIKNKELIAYLNSLISTEALWDYLEQTGSINLLVMHLEHFLNNRKAGIKVLLTICTEYLYNHIGKNPVNRINEIIHKLHRLGAPDMASALSRGLKDRFQKRNSVRDFLA